MNISKARFVLNSGANVGAHFLRLFIGLFMTPFLLRNLGADVYGIMPLVNSCVAFVILATGGLQSSVGRYFTLHIAQGELDEANKYASTAFVLLTGIMVLMSIPFLFFVYFFPLVLEVPTGHEMESRIVVLLLGINIILPLLSNPYTIGLYSQQRFDLRSLVSCINQVIYVILVVASFTYIGPNIIYLAAATLFSNLLATAQQMRISKRLVPSLEISWKLFDKAKVKTIGTYSLWVFVIQVTTLLLLNTDYVIINKLLGSIAVTEYSLAARWNEMIWAVITAAVGVVNPLVTHLEAKDSFEQLRKVLVRGVRFVFLIIIPPSVLLSLFSKELIITWVGVDYLNAVPVFWASLLPLIIIIVVMPATAILSGMGKVKWLAIANLVCAVINIVLSLLFVIHYNLGILGVALATSASLLLKNVFFVPAYTARVIGAPVVLYFREFIRPIVAMLPMTGLAVYLQCQFDLTGWWPLLTASIICVCLFGVTAFFLVLQDEDRRDMRELLTKFTYSFTEARG